MKPLRIFLTFSSLLLFCKLQAQEPNRAILTLVQEDGFNEFDIDISAKAEGQSTSDSDTTTLSGTADITLNIDPLTGTTDDIVINDADISASDMDFTLRVFFVVKVAELSTSDVKGTASTPEGECPVDPATGEFNAATHNFTLNQGALSGDVLGDPISSDFADTPISGAGTGSGTVILTNPVEGENREVTYDVTVTLPVSLDNTIPIGDTENEATVNAIGTLKATGTIFIIRPPTFEEWAAEQGEMTDSQDSFSLSERIPNKVLYALGYDHSSIPTSALIKNKQGLQLNLGPAGQLQDVLIEYSPDLINWSSTAPSRITSVPGKPLVISTPDALGFYRIKVAQ